MSARQILTPDLAAPVPVAAGEVVALPCGRGWGTRATLVCAGPCTIQLRGPDSPRWEVVS